MFHLLYSRNFCQYTPLVHYRNFCTLHYRNLWLKLDETNSYFIVPFSTMLAFSNNNFDSRSSKFNPKRRRKDINFRWLFLVFLGFWPKRHQLLTLVLTSFTYPNLNMDGFSILNGFLGYVYSTQKIFLKFLHAQGLFQNSWFTS